MTVTEGVLQDVGAIRKKTPEQHQNKITTRGCFRSTAFQSWFNLVKRINAASGFRTEACHILTEQTLLIASTGSSLVT
jgi:hypothetical protein